MLINQFFGNYFVEKPNLQLKKCCILEKFGDLPIEDSTNNFFYSLHRFASTRPLCYINRSTTLQLIDYFRCNPSHFIDALSENDSGITNAVFSIIKIAPSWNVEDQTDLSTPNGIRDFEMIWHPEYVRYFENIYSKLITVPLRIIDTINKTKYHKTHIKDQLICLTDHGFGELIKGSSRIMRNAISHGNVYYNGIQIKYVDREEQEQFYASDVLKMFDHLVENCHSIIVSILIALNNLENIPKRISDLNIPFGIIYLVADGLISHNDFQIEYVYENVIQENTQQLHISCSTRTLNRLTQITHAINVAWKYLQHFKSYDRFAFSIECGKSLPNSLFLNGKELQKAIDNNLDLHGLQDVIETSMLWFGGSVIRNKLHTIKVYFEVFWQLFKEEYFINLKNSGWRLTQRKYEIRKIENKSAGKIRRVQAHVQIKDRSIDLKVLKQIIHHSIKRIKRRRYYALNLGKTGFWRRKPSYIWVDYFTEEKSVRTYDRHMYAPFYLLCVEWKKINHDKPILIKSPDVINGKTRIKLNHKSDQIRKIHFKSP